MRSESENAGPNVVSLYPAKESPEFVALRFTTRQHLKDAAATLLDDAIQMAFEGPWKAWAAEQPVGAVANITPESLVECGDSRIASMVRLHTDIMQVHDSLARKRT